jgi:myo-inositol-1(or 4)-monophosphatase
LFLEFAESTAREAGKLTLKYFQTDGAKPEFKGDDTPVTIADKEAEQLIRSKIQAAYPDHEIVGEEYGESAGTGAKSSYRWIIDPIDGTKSFVRGVPLYGVLIALEIDGKVEVGCACFPALNEMVSGATGIGAFWNGKPCSVSEERDLDRAVCAHIDTAYIDKAGKGEAWKRLQQAVYYNAGWCDAYGYLLVATGRVEIMLDPVMAVWDCGPFPPILKEAGGYFGDWHGNEGKIDAGEALATNASLKDEVVKVLEG